MDFPTPLSQGIGMERAIILCDGYFGQSTGKTANGLVRYSKRYKIVGVIDHTKAGRDAGEVLDGTPNGIPIVASLDEAIRTSKPETLIVGVATFGGYIPKEFRATLRGAIENGLNVVAGLHEYLNDDPEFVKLADAHGVRLIDVRKPRSIRDSKQFSDLSRKLPCLRIPVLGTDGAIGKRTAALLLTDALNEAGVPATFVATGQTGLLQGSTYGVPLDSIKADFMVGELESEIVRAYEETRARVVVRSNDYRLQLPDHEVRLDRIERHPIGRSLEEPRLARGHESRGHSRGVQRVRQQEGRRPLPDCAVG